MTIATHPKTRRAAATAALLAALAALAWPMAGQAGSLRAGDRSTFQQAGAGQARFARARASRARTLRATDRATLHYVSSTVDVFYETGRASGTLPGFMRVHMRLGSKFSGRYVIQTAGGSISGSGSATPHGSGTYESFAGTITVTGGTGRFAHASGHARVYGTFDRINNQLKLQTTGTLRY